MKKLFAVMFAGMLFSMSACGSYDNVQSCKDWVEAISCGEYDFTTVIDCNGYESADCDISDYFDCLTDNTTCAEGVPDMSGWATCVSKATCS